MELDFVDRILHFHKDQNWRQILSLNSENSAARKLLWVWPSEENLQLIKDTVLEFSLSGVTSIGCGSGLFEWLLEQFSGLPVIGYEVNEGWWASRYSNPQFIKLNFPELPPTSEILAPSYALLFCYFNNGPAFREYISCYRGDVVFIVGPGPGTGRYTDPEPFNPDFGEKDWELCKIQEVRDSKDFVAVYIRIK